MNDHMKENCWFVPTQLWLTRKQRGCLNKRTAFQVLGWTMILFLLIGAADDFEFVGALIKARVLDDEVDCS